MLLATWVVELQHVIKINHYHDDTGAYHNSEYYHDSIEYH